MDLSYRYPLVDRFREGKKCRLSNSSHPDKASHPWVDSSIFRWCRPIGIPAVKPLCLFLTLLPIKSILRCPEAGETKEGLINQLEQIHNQVPSVLNKGIKAGIVELNWLILRWVISSCIRIKPTISSHESVSIPSPKVLQYMWPCFKAHLHTPAASFWASQAGVEHGLRLSRPFDSNSCTWRRISSFENGDKR